MDWRRGGANNLSPIYKMNYYEIKFQIIPGFPKLGIHGYRTEKMICGIRYTAELFLLEDGRWIVHRFESGTQLQTKQFRNFIMAKNFAANWICEAWDKLGDYKYEYYRD